MNGVINLILELASMDITVYMENGALKIDAPEGVSLDAVLPKIRQQKEDLVHYLSSRESAAAVEIPQAAAAGHYPLSSSQQRLWALSQWEEGSLAYVMPGIYELQGTLAQDALAQAFNTLIERHEILRTVFREDATGEVRQFILPSAEAGFALNAYDLRGSSRMKEELEQLLLKESIRPFTLSDGPLLRASLYRAADDKWILGYALHHIIGDEWSMSVLLRELLSLYSIHLRGAFNTLPALRIQYKDYAAWQQQQLGGESLQAQKEYWLKQLEGELPVLELSTDRPRPAVRTYKGAGITAIIEGKVAQQLKDLSQEQGSTLFMGLLAAVNALLYRYTGQEDMIVGSPIAGREHIDLKEQIGFYVNTLALRTRFSGRQGFSALLEQVKQVTLDAYGRQAYPFDKLVDDLGLRIPAGRHPLFDVMVQLQAAGESAHSVEGLKLNPHDAGETRTSKFDLLFTFAEEADGIKLRIEYNTDIYTEATAARMMAHFRQLLSAMAAQPSAPIAELDYLDETEKQKLVSGFNDHTASYPQHATINSLFEAQAAATPQNIAVAFEEKELSYKELNEKANRLAHYIRNNYTIHPDDLVAVLLERSEKMIIALLAVLKSGAAYVPIDPAYPQERIDYMISDSGCTLVIDAALLKKFYDEEERYSVDNPSTLHLSPSSLAYVIYTSGTTGKPKGSLIEHRNVVRLFKTDRPLFDFSEKDVWTIFHSFCFDFSVWEMYGALLFGGKTVVVSKAVAQDTAAYRELLLQHGVTILNQTPSAFYNLIREELEGEASGLQLRYIIFGGEALSPGRLKEWKEKYPATKLVNMYGITETTVHVTYKEITQKEIDTNSSNIGSPIPTLTCYVLDRNQELLPIGVTGELYVGGEGVCRGYLNREELTAQKFIQSPFQEGERLYRTGDKAKLLENGELEYGGRIDEQVKIRGYRIELGEIENALKGYEQIEDAVVIARANADGEKELLAYLVAGSALEVVAVRSWLGTTLPSYMIPAHFVQLDSLPLTSNGKLDRKALPEPEGSGMGSGVEYVAPRNETEQKLATIWQDILGREGVGVKDNFFDLGGHSIKATRLAGHLHREFHIKIALKDLFACPVLEEQAVFIARAGKNVFTSITPVTAGADFESSSAQRRLWVLSQFAEGNMAYNIPGAIVLEGALDRFALGHAFDEVIARHEILRTVFREDDAGAIRQVVRAPQETGFSITFQDLSTVHDAEENLEVLVQNEFVKPFDLATGPLLRAQLFQVSGSKWVFTYVMHHIISDGWSMDILIKELLLFYNAHTQGKAVSLSPLRIHYKDYAAWLNGQLTGELLAGHKNYWLQQFEGELPLLELPGDRLRPAVKTYSGDMASATLSAGIIKPLKVLAQEQGGTLFMGLLAAVNALLYRYTGQQDIITGTHTSGRDHPDLDDQLGMYLNTLALRARFSGEDNFTQLLENIKGVTLGAYEHQVYPFDELVDALDLQRDMSRNPLFDVSVVLHNTENIKATGEQSAGKLLVSEYRPGRLQTSRFDLSFDFTEYGDEVEASIVYNTDIYSAHTAQQLLRHLQQLLSALLAQPSTSISRLNYLAAEEKENLLHHFNNTKVEYPSNSSIARLFEEQAARTPEAIALVFGNRELTYRGLDEQSNRLAHHLVQQYRLQPGSFAGVLIDRSEQLMIAILAILKTGAAYVPIDPEYPTARKEFIINDTSIEVLLTQTDYLFDLGYYSGEVFAIDVQLDTLETSTSSLSVNIESSDLAYVMYTSGSTGTPKGVMVEQRSVVRLVKNTNFVSFSPSDVLLSTGAVSFDATTFEYWGMLLNGGTLVLCGRETLLDAQRLAEEIKNKRVNMMWFTAGWLNQLVEKDITVFEGLDTIVAGGDKLSPYHINALKLAYPSVKIINGYGPTENTTFSLTCEVPAGAERIPVGKPIHNSTAYILDALGQLVPVGVVGEICVGGDGLARGYLNNAELTEQKFIAHPFLAGARIYKTGDLGRWLPDGTIEFMGRHDEQVKIRGFRIEPGEIESVLQSHEAVEAAVVRVRTKEEEKELIAYIVNKQPVSMSDLRAYLSGLLPAYMIPAHFVQLDQLPLNANGKVDRKALPDPEGSERGVEYVAPRNAIEKKLVQIWQEVLGRETISVKDNFFEIGGHSLKATRLASQLHKELEVKVELKDLFSRMILEEQAELIAQAQKTVFTAIEPVALQESYGLSSSQRRLWVLSQFDEANIAYNIPGIFILKGNLDTAILQHSFDTLIERHEILRTTFREDEQGAVRQYVHPATGNGFRIVFHDLRREEQPEERLDALVKQVCAKPFSLSAGPLLRAELCQLSDRDWVFAYVMHHIISDGWSMDILISELLQLYNAYAAGETNPLLPLRIQYKDYAAWQQQQLGEEGLKTHKNYWLQQFEGELPLLELPTDRPRPHIKTYNGGVVSTTLDASLSSSLRTLCQGQGGTLFMGLLSAVNVLLHRYTGQEDIIIGSPIAGRQHADLEKQIGFYLNTLALRSRFSGTQNFQQLLENVKEVTMEAYEHQAYPFDELVDALNLRRDMSRSPLFDVMVILQNAGNHRLAGRSAAGLTVEPYGENSLSITKFDLLFNFTEQGEEIGFDLEYNSDLYDRSTAERICAHLQQLLEAITTDPFASITKLDYIGAEEKHLLFTTFNDTGADYRHDTTLAALLEEQVQQHPARTALVFQNKTFTYEDLNSRANRLAFYLRKHYNLQANDTIAVQLERSEWMILSLLAVLKSGGAYLPIDPEYPQERTDYIVADSGCKLVINEAELARFREEEHSYHSTNPAPLNRSTDLAYVIYTSGSTGKPKGCMLEHRGVINRIGWMHDHYGYTSEDIILQKTTFTFDVSVWELFLPLCWGMKMVLCHKDDVAAPERIATLIEEQKVTCLHFVPGMLNAFIAALFDEENMVDRLNSLRLVVTSGEALTPATVQNWYDKLSTPLHNLYGPTEASIDVTWYAANAEDPVIPIGRPIRNTQMYVLDSHQALVPLGVSGEICIAGDGLARGYLNKPELTQEKFIAHPFKAGARIYRTGDWGKWLPDGNIEYLGRMDDQVKVRGYRIELGEIENALQSHSAIDAAVVVARADKQGEKELVAYIVSSASINITELRLHLGRTLPAYMVPAYFVQLEVLPLTSSGKVNRKALPAPEGLGMGSGVDFVAPSNETEEKLAIIWQEILGREKIGMKDNFFDLGGHSLKATRLTSQIHRVYEVKLSLNAVFEHPILEEQARLIAQSIKTNYLAIEKAPQQEYYPLSSAQKRLFFLQEFAPQSTGYNMPMVNYLGREADAGHMAAVLRQLMARHESLRTSFEKIDGVAMQKIHSEVSFDLDTHECLPHELEAYVRSYIRPFNLAEAPLLRSSLVHVTGAGYAWIVDIHHIISDGTSHQVLAGDFMRLYRGESLPALRLQYRDFSEWHNSLRQSGELEKQKAYWLSQFEQGIPRLDLPADRPRPAAYSFEGAQHGFTINAQLTAAIRAFCSKHRSTLQMTLLSVLDVLMHKYSGQDDLVIGCGIAGRRHPELEPIVGMFVNALAIRSFPEGSKSFEAFHKEVVTASLAAYDNQDLQFEDLVDMLQVERDASRNPLFDVALVVQNFTRSEEKLPEFTEGLPQELLSGRSPLTGTSKFDMTWFVTEGGEDILVNLEYYSALYDRSTIERLSVHFINILEAVMERPALLLAEIPLLDAAEAQTLLKEYVPASKPAYTGAIVNGLFEEQALLHPDRLALQDSKGTISYGALHERSGRLAAFLHAEAGLQEDGRVALLQSRSSENIVSLLGILRAGGAYVPLDSNYPEERLLYMLEDSGAEVLLTDKSLIELANRLQWRSKALKRLVCIDSNNIYAERGAQSNDQERKALWEHVGDTATDAISAGGWVSSYTGENISAEEMQEFSENAYLKLKPYLRSDMKVLEIGCSSGLTLFQVAPHVGAYHGTDLSSSILQGTAREVKAKGLANITLSCLPAHELDRLNDEGFDLVIINSVVQNFDGHNYLRDVLVKAIGKMKDTGLLFIGDIMDEDRRQALADDLKAFSEANAGKGYRTKTDVSAELFLSRDYLDDLVADGIGLSSGAYSKKIYTIPNELTEFRFDALLTVNRQQSIPKQKKKLQYDLGHIAAYGSSCSREVKSHQLAYVIYTSGSTGQPKGCAITHGNLSNYIQWANSYYYGKAGRPSFGLFTSLSFDLTVTSIFCPLTTGGSLFVYDRENSLPDLLRHSFSAQSGISCIKLTPSHISILRDLGIRSSTLLCAIVGGEEVTPAQVSILKEINPHMEIFNEYGPTEATVGCIVKRLEENEHVLIGRPIAGTDIYILDRQLGLCPPGVPGEICIGGAGLAKGYLNKPVLTAQKFIDNPFHAGERLYRTGDLGRWLPGGEIDFLGRRDDQVKIRGHRIETGEIERTLVQHADVYSAVVMARMNAEGEKELAAYIVAGRQMNTSDLTAHLGKSLPAYMVPSHFVQLEQLPLTTNGKVNRKALPDPRELSLKAGTAYQAPATETERKLVEIWEHILGKNNIGAKDNFFDLGGHSLKATRLASLLYREFEVKIELRDLFASVTPRAQARLIDQARRTTYLGISKVAQRDGYLLSSSQRRLWILSQFEEGNAAYNIPGVYVFEGDLDLDALNYSFRTLVERHESLRTVFREDGEAEVKQYILDPHDLAFALACHDLRNEEREADLLEEWVQSTLATPFDLVQGPLLRVGLFRIADDRWVFAYAMHHIISDGWSMHILIRELLLLYNARAAGQEHPLAPLPIQYKDYAAWQQEQLSGDTLKTHREYWLKQFEGTIPVLQLPGDRIRPAVKTFNGSDLTHTLSEDAGNKLGSLCRENNATLFMGLLAAVNVLLNKYTGQEDIVIGSPIAGRAHADLEGQIGFYLNTLALRTRFSAAASFTEMLARIRQITLDAYEHQVYPFDELVDELNPERDMSRNALFDVMVVLQNTRQTEEELGLGTLKASPYEGGAQMVSKFDLLFDFAEVEGRVRLRLEYNTDIYNRSTAERLARHLEQVVEAIVSAPLRSISELEYASEEEKQRLLFSFNDTAADYAREKTLVQLFEEQAAARADETALETDNRSFTYRQLNEAANGLSAYLEERYRLSPDELAALKLERNEWMVIALLAVLKAGAAYVPIDPAYPQERIDYMITDSGCKLVIDQELLKDFYDSKERYGVEDRSTLPLSPSHLAYVIYTSGSTGQPKGVMITHASVVAFCQNFGSRFFLQPGMAMGASTSYTFDISVLELLGTLANGLKVVLIAATDPADVLLFIEERRINALQLTPSRLGQLLETASGNADVLSHLDVLLVGGEALGQNSYELLKKLPSTKVVNVYGPTETTIWSSSLHLQESTGLSIGRPLLNQSVYILDGLHRLCPAGVTGEICIGGDGLARGYLNNPALTEEKFIADPFHPGRRIYKTGDLGRWLEDGNIEYIGRRDAQVKIRGYRIELGEVESALERHPAVEAAAVTAWANGQGEKELAAYIVSREELNASDLASYLAKLLPAYMLPSHYVPMEQLPLNSSGKLDRKALPNPAGLGMETGAAYVEPRSETEEKLVRIWQQVLGREKIGVKDSFFALGGNSLKATRLAGLIHKEFETKVALRDFFSEPTVEAIAAALNTLLWVKKAGKPKEATDVETFIF